MYKLPENLRDLLKEPIGKVVDEKQLVELLKNEKKIVSIGDEVTYTLLKHDIKPLFCIVDYKTRRGKISELKMNKIKSFGKKSIVVNNPARTITDDLWNIIKYSFENKGKTPIRIEIIGEEDLASLAVINMAPRDVTIIYGLPDKGVLVVKPTDKNKEKVREVLEKM